MYTYSMTTWTLENIKFLESNYASLGASKCAEILKRSPNAIKTKACNLGLTKKQKYWSEEEKTFIVKNFGIKLTAEQCASSLNRTVESVRGMATKLGVRGRASSNHKHSKIAIEWLESFYNINIMHAENGGEYKIGPYSVDGYDPVTNTVYEFHGDAFHGNPEVFSPEDRCNPFDKRLTASQLLKKN